MPARGSTQRRQVSVDDLTFTDEEPPPVVRGRGANQVWNKILDALAERPGQWAKVKDVSASTASNLRKRKGIAPIEARMVDVDANTGRGTLWIRVVAK